MIIGKIREIFAKMDYHTDMLDDLSDIVGKVIRAVRKKYGY